MKTTAENLLLLATVTLVLVGHSIAVFKRKCPRKTVLATFNAAFFPGFVGFNGTSEIEERTSLLIQQIRESNVDIFCLQEVFFADRQRQIVAAVKDKFPYALSAQDLSSQPAPSPSTTACTVTQLLTYQQCIVRSCSNFPGPPLLCAVLKCATVLNSFGSVCRDCVVLHVATGPGICVESPASRFETNYGLMILSRKELKNTNASGYNPLSQFRGYLEASLSNSAFIPVSLLHVIIIPSEKDWFLSLLHREVDGVGDLICTHATSLMSTEAYVGPPVVSPLLYQSYEEQQYAELTTLFQLIVTKDMPILLGDFNHGPASPGNITWELPFHYGLMNARGFYSPYVLVDGRCTFCSTNPTAFFPLDLIIDHIYLPTSTRRRVISSKRFLDDVSDIRTRHGTPLSDHYGVKLTLKDTKENCNRWQKFWYYCPNSPRLNFLDLVAPTIDLGRLCFAAKNN